MRKLQELLSDIDVAGMLMLYAVGILGTVGYIASFLEMLPPPKIPPDETGRMLTFMVTHTGGILSLGCLGCAIWLNVVLWRDRKKEQST